MTPKKIYERVCLILEENVSQEKFIGFYNDTVLELVSQYDKDILFGKNEDFVPVELLSDTSSLKDEFALSVLSNIMYCFTGNDMYKAEFLKNSLSTYLMLWKKVSAGRQIGKKRKAE